MTLDEFHTLVKEQYEKAVMHNPLLDLTLPRDSMGLNLFRERGAALTIPIMSPNINNDETVDIPITYSDSTLYDVADVKFYEAFEEIYLQHDIEYHRKLTELTILLEGYYQYKTEKNPGFLRAASQLAAMRTRRWQDNNGTPTLLFMLTYEDSIRQTSESFKNQSWVNKPWKIDKEVLFANASPQYDLQNGLFVMSDAIDRVPSPGAEEKPGDFRPTYNREGGYTIAPVDDMSKIFVALTDNRTLLELGAGFGAATLKALLNGVKKIYCNDISPRNLAIVAQRYLKMTAGLKAIVTILRKCNLDIPEEFDEFFLSFKQLAKAEANVEVLTDNSMIDLAREKIEFLKGYLVENQLKAVQLDYTMIEDSINPATGNFQRLVFLTGSCEDSLFGLKQSSIEIDNTLICRVLHFFTGNQILQTLLLAGLIMKKNGNLFIVCETGWLGGDWKKFGPVFSERNNDSKVVWPGEVETAKYLGIEKAGKITQRMNFQSRESLGRAFGILAKYNLFSHTTLRYHDRTGELPDDLCDHGRESILALAVSTGLKRGE